MAQSGAHLFREPPTRRFDFAYTSIQRLRDEGISASVLSDTRAQAAIRRASTTINRVTGQWFFPVEMTERISVPFRRPLIHLRNMVPILRISSLTVETGGTIVQPTSQVVTSDRFVVDDRFIELIGESTKVVGPYVYQRRDSFHPGVLNYTVKGAFGWLERRPFSDTGERYKSTTTTTDLADGDTTVEVADASEFRVGDVILIRSGTTLAATFSAHAIVTSIGSPNSLNVDPLVLAQAAPSGSTVITYGQVPEEVQMACVLIVNLRKHGLATEQFRSAQVQGRIRMEQTDNYLYQLDSRSAHTSEANTTGDEEADRLLASYAPPPYVGGV